MFHNLSTNIQLETLETKKVSKVLSIF
jgi:hypothetical protein